MFPHIGRISEELLALVEPMVLTMWGIVIAVVIGVAWGAWREYRGR